MLVRSVSHINSRHQTDLQRPLSHMYGSMNRSLKSRLAQLPPKRARKWLLSSRGSTSPIPIVPGCPREPLAAHFAEHDCKKFVQIQKYFLAGFGNPCDVPFRSLGIARNPHNENKRSEKTRWPLQF